MRNTASFSFSSFRTVLQLLKLCWVRRRLSTTLAIVFEDDAQKSEELFPANTKPFGKLLFKGLTFQFHS